jgi:hypothetical protein
MQSEQQFNQLMMQYNQLKNGALDIASMIEREDYDSAITMLKNREQIFLSCKCMRRYLELTPIQEKEAEKIFEEIKELELKNIKKLEDGMQKIQLELAKTQKSQKLQNAYSNGGFNNNGSIVNYKE